MISHSRLACVLCITLATTIGNAQESVRKSSMDGAKSFGVQPKTGESSSELNKRLLKEFGRHPYGVPADSATLAKQEAERRELQNRIAQEVEHKRAVKRLREADEARAIPEEALPSLRSVLLGRTLKNPRMLRDELEAKVRWGEISASDLRDAELGNFERNARFSSSVNGWWGGVSDQRQLDKSAIQDLTDYQNYLRNERLYRAVMGE